MKERIRTAIVITAILSIIFFILPQLLPFGLAVLLYIAAKEWQTINQLPQEKSLLIAAFFLYGLGLFVQSEKLLVFLSFAVAAYYVIAFFLIVRFESSDQIHLKSNDQTFLGPLILASFALNFNFIFSEHGVAVTLFLITSIALADSGAYFAGKSFGKKHLSPKTSPKKTIEGLIGGLLASIASMILFSFFLPFDFFKLLLVGVSVVIVSVIGDLYISLIKRQNQIKDSGTILPGHGGILDRIDSYLPSYAVMLLYTYYFL